MVCGAEVVFRAAASKLPAKPFCPGSRSWHFRPQTAPHSRSCVQSNSRWREIGPGSFRRSEAGETPGAAGALLTIPLRLSERRGQKLVSSWILLFRKLGGFV